MARRHQTLIPLSREHHDSLLLAWRLRTGDLSSREPALKARHAAAFFESRLRMHFDAEERVLFPAVRGALGAGAALLDELIAEHRSIAALAADLRNGAIDAVARFCDLLERHIRTEERQLFPLIEERVAAQSLAALEAEVENALSAQAKSRTGFPGAPGSGGGEEKA
ncbi:MAG: hemerythrin domain-containing protein [Candidatus Binataceae bacterium]